MDKPFAITLDPGSSLANKTGSWRTERPVYVDRLPPCNAQCPAGEDIQGWLFHAESGDYEQAWRKLVEDNPFPATMGRVCYHTCEGACNRAKIDEAVGINSVEGFLGDQAIARGWKFPAVKSASGKKVLVVGDRPDNLAARTLGETGLSALWRVHLPLLLPTLGSAALIVFVDGMKELAATLLLRPFNFETLATHVYSFAALEQFEKSALGALTIVLIGLLPVLLLHEAVASGRSGSGHEAPRWMLAVVSVVRAAIRLVRKSR